MSLRFIVGRAGSGKTHTCLNEIRQILREAPDGAPLILLVPEQATFQMEYALATTPGLGGTMRAQVLSFRRLAWRVLAETGGASRVPLGDLGKRMVLRRLLEQRRDELALFGYSAERPGFADRLARGISEMKKYRVTPETLGALVSGGSSGTEDDAAGDGAESVHDGKGHGPRSLLQSKLSDLEMLYRDLEEYMSGRYTDPDEYLNLLAGSLDRAPVLAGAQIWLDGFAGFTPQELHVLKGLFKAASRVHVALCLDCAYLGKASEDVEEDDLFYPTWKTWQELSAQAREAGVGVEEPLLLDDGVPHRFRENNLLAHLEKGYFVRPTEVFAAEGDAASLRLVPAANRRAEVEAVARELLRLSRERGYRWRDMSLVLRELEPYHDLIATVFDDYGIPYFIDRKRPVMHHPLVELARSALEIYIKDWSYDPVFRYLKTDLAPVSRREVDFLENYVLAHGIRGKRWTDGQDWGFRRRYTLGEDSEISAEEEAELARVNEIRRRAAAEVAAFCAVLDEGVGKDKPCLNYRSITTALYNLLEALDVPTQLAAWAAEAEKEGRLVAAREHAQVWGGVMSLFDELAEALGEEECDAKTYLAVLDAGLESLTLGLIPPGLDQVLVGSLDRSRNPDIKACFVLGASDGVLPAKPAEDGIFTEPEREELAGLGLSLAPGARQRVFEEQFLVYIALTRPSELLWVSFPLADEEGKAIGPSTVIARLKELIPKELIPGCDDIPCPVAPTGLPGEEADFISHPGRSLSYLLGSLRQAKAGRRINPAWWDVYNWFAGDESRRLKLSRVLPGIFHRNEEKPLHGELSRSLYGNPVRASVSRVEKYRACPFAYFTSYGLKLKDRSIYQLAAPDMGEFFHAALKLFVERIREKGLAWGELTPGEVLKLTEQVVKELAPQLQSEILLSSARYRYLAGKMQNTVARAAMVLGEHDRRGIFRPVGLELGFGFGGELPSFNVALPNSGTLELHGRIDRIDMAVVNKGEQGEEAYLRVIDYKSSDQGIELGEIYHGLRLQLLSYLHVALQNGRLLAERDNIPGETRILPAGVLYFTVKDPLIKKEPPVTAEEAAAEVVKALKMQGILLADEDVVKLMDGNLQAGSSSDIIPAGILKSGGFRSSSKVFTLEQFNALRGHLENLLSGSGGEMLSGNVAISPYRYKDATACRYCEYKPVCRFDIYCEENAYRNLPKMSTTDVWVNLFRGGDLP